MSEIDSLESEKNVKLTASQLQRMKKNREKALQLRKARIANSSNAEKAVTQKEVCTASRARDTGAGFFAEDDESDLNPEKIHIVSTPAPLFALDRPICLECNEEFNDSYLQTHFDFHVCDSCRDNDGAHALISKTDAKKEYLLQDCDLDKREPPLKYVLRKNPHNLHGSMKLYLRLQVENRSFEVHGSEEAIEEKKEQREENQLKRKKKAFDKKVKALRMEVRSSLYRKKDATHKHTFDAEVYNEEDDVYIKTCTSCGHQVEFEKISVDPNPGGISSSHMMSTNSASLNRIPTMDNSNEHETEYRSISQQIDDFTSISQCRAKYSILKQLYDNMSAAKITEETFDLTKKYFYLMQNCILKEQCIINDESRKNSSTIAPEKEWTTVKPHKRSRKRKEVILKKNDSEISLSQGNPEYNENPLRSKDTPQTYSSSDTESYSSNMSEDVT
ncbi:DNA repair protein complementing XP-A cells homolog [Caerostris darwini]|uniref:DNA repair protein complementing XP-A cells homolog n=1 Tax=Caerostris darwini TaxID=1538125 RepID=A0AAV4TX51_9ARAC|nr:DNA repair protein complementing XP-A cells homolog [Caerostris darwini]